MKMPCAGVLVAAVLIAGCDSNRSPSPSSSLDSGITPSISATEVNRKAGSFSGAASCAASACHGDTKQNEGANGIWGNEYRIWAEHDPHSKSYETLLLPQSADITKRFGLEAANRSAACLGCHAPQISKQTPKTSLASGGVSCESCHGEATNWLAAHSQPGWRQRSTKDKLALGFQDLHSLVPLAKACVGCHVGETGRNVDHDLIAAGHPRLTFELGSYLSYLPKHWSDNRIQQNHANFEPDFELRLWAVGQAVAAEQSARLLAAQAQSSTANWPEFSHWDCTGCHHDVSIKKSDHWLAAPLKRGLPQLQPWYLALPMVASQRGLTGMDGIDALVLLQRMNDNNPNRKRVAAAVQPVVQEIQSWLKSAAVRQLDARQLVDSLAHDERVRGTSHPDIQIQRYLALVALLRSSTDDNARIALKAELHKLRQEIRNTN